MVGLPALYALFLATQRTLLPPLPQNLIDVLGANIVLSNAVFSWLDVEGLTYSIVQETTSIDAVISGAVLAGGYHELGKQLVMVEKQQGWLAKTYLLVVTSATELIATSEIWTGRVVNLVFYTGRVYIYHPFKGEVVEVRRDELLGELLAQRWKDLNGYPVTVGMFRHQLGFIRGCDISPGAGLDATALYELAKYWNMTIKLFKIKNPKYHTTNDDLIVSKTDLSMNARFITGSTQIQYLEYSTTVLGDAVVIVLKETAKIRGWEVMVKIYKWQVWLLILLTIAVVCKLMTVTSGRKELNRIISLILRCLFSIPINKMTMWRNERLLLIPLILLSNVVLSSYLARLYHIIEVPSVDRRGQRREKIKTLEEFTKTKMPLLAVRHGMRDYFESRLSPTIQSLGLIIRVKNMSDRLFEDAAYVMREKEFKFLLETNSIRKDLYVINEKVLSFTLAYVVRRGSPFLEPLSNFTAKVFEAGLNEKWYSMTVDRVNKAKPPNDNPTHESQERKPLNLWDVEVAFFSLYVGLFISLVVFFLELAVKYFLRRKLRRLTTSQRAKKNICQELAIPYAE